MNAAVVMVIVLLSSGDMARTGSVGTAYFGHIDVCKAAADEITKQVKAAGGQIVVSCQFTMGAATR